MHTLPRCRLREQQLVALQELLRAEIDVIEGSPLQVPAVGERHHWPCCMHAAGPLLLCGLHTGVPMWRDDCEGARRVPNMHLSSPDRPPASPTSAREGRAAACADPQGGDRLQQQRSRVPSALCRCRPSTRRWSSWGSQ